MVYKDGVDPFAARPQVPVLVVYSKHLDGQTVLTAEAESVEVDVEGERLQTVHHELGKLQVVIEEAPALGCALVEQPVESAVDDIQLRPALDDPGPLHLRTKCAVHDAPLDPLLVHDFQLSDGDVRNRNHAGICKVFCPVTERIAFPLLECGSGVYFLVFKISFYIGLIFVYWTGSVYICVWVALVYC